MLHEYLNSINCCAHQKLISLLLNILSNNYRTFHFYKSKTMSPAHVLILFCKTTPKSLLNPKILNRY